MSKVTSEYLAALLQEIKNRNLDISEYVKDNRKPVEFPTDGDGYFIRRNGKLYKPTDSQRGFILSQSRYSLYVGARGSGKSAAGSQKALHKIALGLSGAVLNPDFENFRISTWPEFREWIPWNMVVPKHRYRAANSWQPDRPFILSFMTGAKAICKGLKDPDSARGPNINWLWYDEPGRDPDGESWKIAVASVRVGENPQAWATGTPAGMLHWLYKFFIEKDIPPEAAELLTDPDKFIEVYEGSIMDNAANLDPEFLASMLVAYPEGSLRQQELYGKFVSAGGNLGNRSYFRDKIISELPGVPSNTLRFWDLAATEKKLFVKRKNDPDETVGTRSSFFKDLGGRFVIENQRSGHWAWDEIKRRIRDTAIEDGLFVKVVIEEEPGSGGKNQVAEIHNYLRSEIPGHPGCTGYRPEGDRVSLANIWYAEAAQGLVYLLQGEWIGDFLNQFDDFPNAKHDDKITSVSGARINVAPIKKWKRMSFLHL